MITLDVIEMKTEGYAVGVDYVNVERVNAIPVGKKMNQVLLLGDWHANVL